MADVTQLLDAAATGDPQAAAELLPLVYDELRKLAAARMTAEAAGHTLQPTALVHEAYLRLVDSERRGSSPPNWNGRGHFFAAAAEAMRRILVEQARRKHADKRGGNARRVPLDDADIGQAPAPDDLLDIDAALTRLAAEDPQAARLVELRYFASLSLEEAAAVIGIARSTSYEHWSYARVRLRCLLDGE
jgi:RNA polymerase sigma factor (TIGR02999 family)